MNRELTKYKKEFTEKALAHGYSSENIGRCLTYSEPLILKKLPVIYNTSHFCALVGYQKNYVGRAVYSTKYFYRKFKIKKKNGEYRELAEPLPSLKEIQTWILEEILYKVKPSKFCKAYTPKRSIRGHAKYHSRQSKVLTLDIKNFFGSIKPELIKPIFNTLGYSDLISKLLTDLCFLKKSLPQGSPTSPYLSNILLIDFDSAIGKYCEENKIKYTRYADDLAFSGNIKKIKLIKFVKSELAKLGLKLNNSKTKLMRRHQRQEITGIVVNRKVQVPKQIRNQIRNQMFYIKKFGLASHIEKTNNEKANFLKHLKGNIGYILQLNPKDKEFKEYMEYLKNPKP